MLIINKAEFEFEINPFLNKNDLKHFEKGFFIKTFMKKSLLKPITMALYKGVGVELFILFFSYDPLNLNNKFKLNKNFI